MTKMAAMSICGKTLQNSSTELVDRGLEPIIVYSLNDVLWLILTYFAALSYIVT